MQPKSRRRSQRFGAHIVDSEPSPWMAISLAVETDRRDLSPAATQPLLATIHVRASAGRHANGSMSAVSHLQFVFGTNGNKVIFVPFADGKASGAPQDVLTGFVDAKAHARSRPVDVAVDKTCALLVADDEENTV